MKKVFISIVAVVTLVVTADKASAQTVNPYGFTQICGLGQVFKPPLQSYTDARYPKWWTAYDKTPCEVRKTSTLPGVKLEGTCTPFPNKTTPVSPTAPSCTAGTNERVHAYVCNTGNYVGEGCGGSNGYSITNLPSGTKYSLGDLQKTLGSNYKCGQTVQVEIFNKVCTPEMIGQHYKNISGLTNPAGDANGNGIEDQMELQYYAKDAAGKPQFCLAKDAFVWYTGTCQEVKKNPVCVISGPVGDMYVNDSRNYVANSTDPDGGVTNLTQMYSSPTAAQNWTSVSQSYSSQTAGSFKCPYKGQFYITCNARDDENVFCSGNPFNDNYVDCGPEDTRIVNCIDRPVLTPNLTIDKFIDSSKTVGTTPYKTGDVIAFGITVKNTGNTNLVDIALTDTIPAYTEFDAVKTQQLNGGVLNWGCTTTTCSYNRSLSLAIGESKTLYFAVKVKAYTVQGDIKSKNKVCANVNGVSEKCDEVPFDLKDIVILKSIYIDKMIDASKTVGTAPYKANDVIAFHVRVKNTGNTKLENVVLKDVVPALTTFNAQATATLNAGIGVTKLWACTGTNCSLAIGTLEVNQTFDVYFAAKVSTYERYGEDVKSDNTACVVTSSITGEKCDTVPFDLKDLVNPTKSISIVKTIEGSPKIYAAGEYVKFKVVVKNTGATNLTNVVVTDPIPAYTSFDSAKTMEANGLGGFAWTCNTTTCTSNLGSMAAGSTKTGYLVVKVKNYEIYDTDVKSENEACVVATPIEGRKCSKVTFDLKDLANPTKSISIVKTIEGSKNQYEANDKIIFKVSVRNTGNTTLTNVVVTDDVPEYTTFDAAGTRLANSGNSYVWNCDGRECRVNIGTMESGATKTVFYAVTVDAYEVKDTDVKSENKACVVTTELPTEKCSTVPFDLKDLESPKASSITIDKTIDSSKSEGSAPYESLKSLVFKIVVTNDGETDLTDVKVTDDVPAYTTFDGAKTDSLSEGWSCEAQKCTNTIGSLEKGASVTLYYAVKIIDTTAVTTAIDSKNTACVVADGVDPSSLEECDTVDFDIKDNEKPKEEEDEEGSELSISKKVRKEGDDRWEDKITDVEEGDVIEFKIKVTNKSDEDTKSIDDLKMLDKLPKELEKLSGGLTEYWDDFEAGDDKSFTIKAKVRSSEFDGNVDKCVDNRAYVYKDKNEKDSDRATVCYSNVEVTELPETGAGLAMTLGGFITSAAGIVLKKKRA